MTELGPFALVAAVAAAYAAGVSRAWGRAGRGRLVHTPQVVMFALGLIATVAVLVGPIDARADHSLTMHMIQHVVLLSVAAPLLAAGEPFTALLWALDDPTRAKVSRWWRRVLRTQYGFGWFVWIAVTLALQTVTLLAWHLPAAYDAAIRHPLLHGLEHLSFLLSATAFWWVVACTGWKSRHGAGIFAVAAAWFPGMALGAAMITAKAPWYQAYVTGSPAAALADQQMAGVVMWAFGGFASIVAGVVLFAWWLQAIDRRNPSGEPVVVPTLEVMR
jgi:cytochrome c oxidase assembly factor CtaG